MVFYFNSIHLLVRFIRCIYYFPLCKMRRSSAPSIKADVKRPRFFPPFLKNITQTDKENKCFSSNLTPAESLSSFSKEETNSFSIPTYKPYTSEETKMCGFRTNEDILELIFEEDCVKAAKLVTKDEIKSNSTKSSSMLKIPKLNISESSVAYQTFEDPSKTLANCILCSKNMENALLFNVVWCKRSGKKHKTWEGDGFLIVRNRSAILKDFSGKVLDKGLGYRLKDVESLEDGSKFYIGGKECEIQHKIPPEEYERGKYCKCNSEQDFPLKEDDTKKFEPPKILVNKFCPPVTLHFQSQIANDIESSIFDENSFVLPPPPSDHQTVHNKEGLPLVDVCVDSFLTKQLRSHQKEGISFMYKCIMGFQHEFGRGVILADEMGLGKTLQCIALIWALYKRGPFGGLPVLKKVIIITPSSLVTNWLNEFHKWLGKLRLSIFAVNQKNTVKDYLKSPKAVLIISYEMFLRCAELLSSVVFDLVICDEGHRIKNLNIKISNVVNCLCTTRRILLTGTPIQNDLAEFFSIVDFVNPGALGSIQYFRKAFEKPIIQSRNEKCSEEEKEYGEERSEELSNITKMFMLRRTQEVINQYLPPKTEYVVFCRPSELQKKLYQHLLKSREVIDILTAATHMDMSTPLTCISVLRKLCNHPSLLHKNKISEEEKSNNSIADYMESALPRNYQIVLEDSGKMKVLEIMLSSLFSSLNKEKVVIVSSFTKTLDILELLCKLKHYEFLRLDGSTTTSSRQEIVDVFNRSYTKYSIFLLSSKAGGVGFNLVGASRIILYDIDWNPANDLQAMARIWRDGQRRDVYVYRLLTAGTIEEKMYQRQLSKQCLSGSVLDTNSTGKLRFSREELMDLFTFHENTRCTTHDLINCKCLSLEYILNLDEFQSMESNSSGQMKNVGMAELMNWTHVCGPISNENCSDPCLVSGGNDITFLFQNMVNARK